LVRAQQIRGTLDPPGPAQTDIGTTDRWLSRDQLEAITRLVDAEQRAAQRDLAYQALPLRRVIQMRVSAEQSVVEREGRF
jgi:hypothetical protein